METSQGFAFYIDRTLKELHNTYLKVFQQHNIDLTMEQWAILEQIQLHGEEASQKKITETNYRNRATTSRLIQALCDKGLINKDRFEGDLKQYKLTLTEAGHRLYEKVYPVVIDLRSVGYHDIHEDEFDSFIRVLNKIWKNYSSLTPPG